MRENYVFVQSANLNQFDSTSLLNSSLISQQVIEQASQFNGKRQLQFVACRYLLAELLNDYFDIPSLPNIIIGLNQRPHFEKANLPDFNISHSGDYIAVAVCSEGKIGIDIEQHRPRKQFLNIAKQFFSEQEIAWMNQQKDNLSAFWQLWTLRESALKLYAKGVWQMKELQIDMQHEKMNATFGNDFYFQHQQLAQIYLSICCNYPINKVISSS